jgi:hypothetical protein
VTSHLTALTALLLVGSMAVSAQAQSAGAPVGVAPAIVRPAGNLHDPNQVICKSRGEPGHLGGRRLCGTRAQWEQVARDGADTLTRVQNGSGFTANAMDGGMNHSMGPGH